MANDNNANPSGPNIKRVRRTPAEEIKPTSVYVLPPLIHKLASIKTIEFKGFDFLQAHVALNSPKFIGVDGLVKGAFNGVKAPEVKTFWSQFFKPMKTRRNKPDMLNDLVELVIQVHKSQNSIYN